MTLPEQLLNEFDLGCKGQADVDMRGILHAIIGDVVDSFRLALSDEVEPAIRQRVITEVEDYIANNYGDD